MVVRSKGKKEERKEKKGGGWVEEKAGAAKVERKVEEAASRRQNITFISVHSFIPSAHFYLNAFQGSRTFKAFPTSMLHLAL